MQKHRNPSSKSYSSPPPLDDDLISIWTKEYVQAVEREWSILHINEIEVPLKDIYVMLQAVASLPPKILEDRSDLAELPERMTHAGFSAKDVHPVPVQLSQALQEAQNLVLLGEPGSGKSTTLQFIGLCFVHEGWALERLQLVEKRIPIKLDLRSYSEILVKPGLAMEQALKSAVRDFLREMNDDQIDQLITIWREQGELLVLLDGLDEVPDHQRAEVRNEIKKFAAWGTSRQCRLVMASRIAGYYSLGDTFKEFILKPFEQAQEVIPYLESWLTVFQKDQRREQLQAKAIYLHQQMDSQPALRRVLDNPLLLRIAAQVYTREGQIASSRAELYKHYVEDLWMRAVERGADSLQKEVVWKYIHDVAWDLQINKKSNISTELENIVRLKMGLIVRTTHGLAFSHLTIREYFAAQKLAIAWRENRAGAWAFIRPLLHIGGWREPILLLCGSLSAEDAGQFILQIINAKSPYEPYLFRDKLLAASVVGENPLLPALIKNKVVSYVLKVFKSKNARSPAVKALRELKTHEAIPTLILAVKYGVAQRDAVAALEELIAVEAMPTLIRMVGVGYSRIDFIAEALQKLKVPEAIPYLINILKDNNHYVRQEAVEMLRAMKAVEAIPALVVTLNDPNVIVRHEAACALAEMDAKEIIPQLMKILEADDAFMRWSAGIALGKLKAVETIPYLIQAFIDKDHLRSHIIKALGELKAVEAIPLLVQVLMGTDPQAKDDAAKALININSIETVHALLLALKDGNQHLSSYVPDILGKMKAVEAIPQLIEMLSNENEYIRHTAVEALGNIKAGETIPKLIRSFTDVSWYVRLEIGYTLQKMNWNDAKPQLIEALMDEDWRVRCGAAKLLGEKKTSEAIPTLLSMLQDQDEIVRYAAADALGKMNIAEAIPTIILMIEDAAKVTGPGKNDVIPQHIQVQQDIKRDTQRSAARLLGKMKVIDAIPALTKVLNGDSEIWESVAYALGELKAVEAIPELLAALRRGFSPFNPAKEALEKMKVPEAIPHLIRALGDGDSFIKREEATRLGELKAVEAVPSLILLLRDEWEYARKEAAWSLGEIKAIEAAPALIALLNDDSSEVRRKVVTALGKMNAVAAIPRLIQIANEDRQASGEAVKALYEMNVIAVIPHFISHLIQLATGDWYHRNTEAIVALGKLRAIEAIPVLVRCIDGSGVSKRELVTALGQMPPNDVIPKLIPILYSRDSKIQEQAASILREIILASPMPVDAKERKKQVKISKEVLGLKLDYSKDLLLSERLAIADAESSPYNDPLETVKPLVRWKMLRLGGYMLLIILILSFLTVLSTLYGTAQDVFKSLLGPYVSSWITDHPIGVVFTSIGLAVIISLLAWGLERLKDSFQKKT